jgi:hypothetical protein
MKKSRILYALVWVVGGLAVGYLVWRIVPAFFQNPSDAGSIEYLSRVAEEINRSVPVMIDPETELLPTEAAPATLIYNYRLVSYSAAQLDPEKFAAGVKEKVTPSACNRPETRDEFLKRGVTLRYSYFDKDKNHIATVDVTPADCGFS